MAALLKGAWMGFVAITFRGRSIRIKCSSLAFVIGLSAGCGLGSVDKATEHRPHVSVPSDGFTNFETEPVRPLALSEDGRYLYALNTADDRLEIFDASGENLRSVGETTVGLRPVAVVLRGGEAWVVNHLSDSVSVGDVRDPARPRVVHTLQVGDEPRGIVVGGPKRDRIFVATARRDETLTAGVGRAQLWIFDARQPTAPAKILTLFGTKARALEVSADGRRVYAAVFLSGNGTTTVSGEATVQLGLATKWSLSNIPYGATPKQGAIGRRSAGVWRDAAGRDWSAAVPFELPDYDLFVIDASAEEPKVIDMVSNIGTVLFNLAVQPISGEVWVTNTDAANFTPYEPRLQGKFAGNRVTRVVAGETNAKTARPIDLNRHIDRGLNGGDEAARELSLAQPLDIVFAPDGQQAFVAAFGSNKVAVLDGSGNVVDRIKVGFGPGGLALDARRQRLYILNHLEATISVVDLRLRRAIHTVPLRYDPTPPVVRLGRPFFYDASVTSRYGDLSCATCHVF